MNSDAPGSNFRLWGAVLLALLGIGSSIASIYATPAFVAEKLSCGIEALDCTKALTSKYSKVMGIPLGIFGLLYFSFWGMNLRAAMRTRKGLYRLALTYVTLLGALVSIVLGTIMFFVLEAPCLYCMVTHTANIAAVILVWPIMQFRAPLKLDPDQFWHFAAMSGVAILAASSLFFANQARQARAALQDAEMRLEASQIESLDW